MTNPASLVEAGTTLQRMESVRIAATRACRGNCSATKKFGAASFPRGRAFLRSELIHSQRQTLFLDRHFVSGRPLIFLTAYQIRCSGQRCSQTTQKVAEVEERDS